MKLRTVLTDGLEEKNFTSETVLARCELAKNLEEAGDYQAAIAALGQLWTTQAAEIVENLTETAAAELLLRKGVLSGWLGSTKQIEGSQDEAKDLISKSITIFESLPDITKVAEAETELAYCYWRQGAFDEARALLDVALSRLPDEENDRRATVHLRRALIESSARRRNDTLRILIDARPLFDSAKSHALKGKFHNELGLVFQSLADAEQRTDYLDRALIEFTASSFHFEQAGHRTYQGCVENNLALLFLKLAKFEEAHQHLDHARQLLFAVENDAHLAQVNETRARVFLAEQRLTEAERIARTVVKALETGGQHSLLAEALTTYGVALARVGRRSRSKASFERAIAVAETSGDLSAAGRARLCLIEELGDGMPVKELATIYQAAAELLEPSQDPATTKQLSSCTRKILEAVNTDLSQPLSSDSSENEANTTWEGFSFRSEVIRYEQLLIQRALRDAGGVVSRAAQLLGFKHHQSLISLLNTRHKTLIQARSPVRSRRRSIISARRKSRRMSERSLASKRVEM